MKLKLLLTSVLFFVTEILGGWDTSLKALCFLIFADYSLAVFNAIVTKDVSITKHIQGIIKKVGYIFLIGVSVTVGKVLNQDFHEMIVYFLIVQETLSIIKNLQKMGVPIPSIFSKQIEKLSETEVTIIPKEENDLNVK